MRVYLLRHGIAIDRDHPESPSEAERHLTREGIFRTRAAARGMAWLDISPGRVLSSPWLRARQTAEICIGELDLGRDALVFSEALLWDADPRQLIEELKALKKEESVLCVGHAPHLDQVIAFLVGSRAPFTSLKKAGLACLEFDPAVEGTATLLALYPPKVLRALGEKLRRK